MWSSSNSVSFNADSQGNWGNWWTGWVRAFGDRSWGQSAGYAVPGGDNYTMSLAGLPDVVTEKTSSVNIPPFLKQKWANENSGDYLLYRLPNLDSWRVDGKGAPADYIIAWLAGWVEEFGIDGFRCDTAKHVTLDRWNQLKNACKTALNNWRASSRADQYAQSWTDDFWMTGEAFGWDHGDTGYFTSGGFDSMINFAFNSSEGSSGRTPTVNDWTYYANYCNGSSNRQVLNYVSSHDTGLHRPGDQKNVATMLLLCPGGAQIFYGDETSRPYMSGCNDASMSTRSDFNWDAVDNADNKHWQKIGQFRRRNPAVGAGTQTALGSDTYGRTFADGDYTNAVVIRLNTSAGQTYNVSVSGIFADGTKVMDGYNTDNTATVSGGTVSMQASGPVLLIEPFGQISDEVIDDPTIPQKPVVTASPASTTFSESVTVSLSVNPAGTPIYYSTSGTASASSTLYSEPLTFTETTTLSTYVANEAGSNVQSFTYTKSSTTDPDDPIVDPDVVTINGDYNLAYTGSHTHVHYWGGDTSTTWPGVTLTTVTGSDGNTYKVAKVANGTTGIVFNNGGNGSQTGDLTYTGSYAMNDSGSTSTKVTFPGASDDNDDNNDDPVTDGYTVYFDNSASNWSTVYCYTWTDGSSDQNAAWPGIAMTHVSGNIYSYTATTAPANVIFTNGSGEQTSDLTWTTGHKYNKNGDQGAY